jgi:hypothetical protein
MRLIWYHCCRAWQRFGVAVPVLSAIGCGAFRGDGPDAARVPYLWAEALAWALGRGGDDYGFDAVVVALPVFGGDDNFTPFVDVLRRSADRLAVPVVLTRRHGMLSVAARVAGTLGRRAGFLNPSDVVALQAGKMGMYWDRGHVALEELLAVQTTVLFHHRDLNAPLYERSRLRYERQPTGAG